LSSYRTKIRRLALSIAGGSWDRDALSERLSRTLGGGPPDPGALSARLLFHFDRGSPPTRSQLIDFLGEDEPLRQAMERSDLSSEPRILLDPPVMAPLPGSLVTFPLPQLPTWKDLRLWLGVSDGELAWLADSKEWCNARADPGLHHYRYLWLTKRSGEPRLIEMPKSHLKEVQRQILHEILDRVPPHPCAHGFRRRRSCLSYVAPHVGKEAVLRMDLKDYFHSVPPARIGALFRRLGYPWTVARTLQGLCTHALSPALAGAPFEKLPWEAKRRLQHKHLPQGAPTSPAVANLCTWRLDTRLQGIAEHLGLDYTRYADDLAFSGGRRVLQLAPFLQGLVGAVAIDDGFHVNHRKTRLQSKAQSQRLAGMVVNEKPNLPRKEYDRLRAILYNFARSGPKSQTEQEIGHFKRHLAGRVAYASWLNPNKGARLKALWEQIVWP